MKKLWNWILGRTEPEDSYVPPEYPVAYPSGTCVMTEDGKLYYIKKSFKYLVPTVRVLQSWKFNNVVYTTNAAISKFAYAGKLAFRDGALLKNFADGKLYLVSDNKRRHIVNPDLMELYGLKDYWIIEVSESELNLQEEGEKLA